MTAELERLVAAAAAALDAATGSTAVCTYARSGTPVPGIKYAEGRWAALRELQRRTARGAPEGTALHEVRDGWRRHLDALTARGAGPDWVAYRTGGVDALDELDELREEASS